MSLPVHCSNILVNQAFTTANDFTVSFTYNMDTGGFNPVANDGFAVFFIDGNVANLLGGGLGPGLGVVSGTDTSSTSAVQGVFATLGFDIAGNFSIQNSIPVFTTGRTDPTNVSNLITLRSTSDFTYIDSSYTVPINPYLFGPLGPAATPEAFQTIRVSVRNSFSRIDVHSLSDQTYVKLASFNTNLSSIPPFAKCGISYSGDTIFNVRNITVNYT